MTPDQIEHLVTTLLPALFPASAGQLGGGTAAAWTPSLTGIRVEDATLAAQHLAERIRFVALCDLLEEVRAIRRARLDAPGVGPAIDALAADLDGDPATYRQIVRAVADGAPVAALAAAAIEGHAPAPALTGAPLALEGLVRDVP